jgi:hypothetical protein
MHEYHYSLEGKTFGPVSLEQLKGLSIKKDTLVWRDGLVNWVKAESLEELKDLFKVEPPPLRPTPPPLNHSIAVQSSQEEEEKRERIKKIIIWSLIGLGVLLFLILLIKAAGKSDPKNKEKEITEAAQPSIDSQYEAAVSNGDTSSSAVGGGTDNSQTTYTPLKKKKKKTEEEILQKLYEKEILSPKKHLILEYKLKYKIISGKDEISGTILNAATIAGFKDIVLKIEFKSETSAILDTEYFTIYKYVYSNQSIPFIYKTYSPSGTRFISVDISSAEGA